MSTSNPVSRTAALLALLACLSASAAFAQIWQGPASLEIRAEGKGGSMAGATVELLYLALDPPAGPPPVHLDSRGRAVVSGLAEGMWRVSVSREGFMTYQAEVDVRRDEKPEMVATFQQNVPGATRMIQVKIARAKPAGPSAPPPPPRIAERPAPRPAEPPPAPAPAPSAPRQEPETPPAEAPTSHATPMLVPPETPPSAEPQPQPQPAAPAPAPTPRPQQPPPEMPSAPPPSEPPAEPAPAPAPPTPQPAPPQAAPTPAPPPPRQPAPPAPAAPGGSVLSRSYADRTCYECKPGEASLSVERVVSSGVGCGPVGRDLLAHNGDPGGLPEGCAVLRLNLPPGARYTGYRYEIQERGGSVDCLAGRDCPGGGRWPADPAIFRSDAGTVVSAAFENLGTGGERRAILTIYYTER